jgi:hypothetical protein
MPGPALTFRSSPATFLQLGVFAPVGVRGGGTGVNVSVGIGVEVSVGDTGGGVGIFHSIHPL